MTNEEQNLDQLWHGQRKNEEDIGDLKEGQARTEAGLLAIGDQMRAGFHTMNQSLQINNQPKPPFQWLPLGSLLLALLLAFGYFFTQATETMQRESDLRFTSATTQLTNMEGEVRAWLQANTNRMTKDDERERSDAYDQGVHTAELKSLNNKVDHLDERRHVEIDALTARVSDLAFRFQKALGVVRNE